jgi:hypothetical protein
MTTPAHPADQQCPECNGSGLEDSSGFGDLDACEECGGSGRVKTALAAHPVQEQAGQISDELLRDVREALDAQSLYTPSARNREKLRSLIARLDDALSASLVQQEGAAPKGEPIALNIIRRWPAGFAERLEHVWRDVVGFIPSYKLYDLQRMLGEYGFTMAITRTAPPHPRLMPPSESSRHSRVLDK